MKVDLTPKQVELKQVIEGYVNKLRDHYSDINRLKSTELDKTYREMADVAHELHMQLDPKPKHSQQMIKNSEMSPEDPDFYYHLHPTEDLLAYLENTSANDDPVDHTLGSTFNFKVYSRRWGHKDNYTVQRNEEGWNVAFNAYDLQGDHSGSPAFEKVLGHDHISFPSTLGDYLNSIWILAKDKGLKHEEVQKMLDEVSNWISSTEENAPSHLLI